MKPTTPSEGQESVERLFESELRTRNVPFKRDPSSGLYSFETLRGQLTVSLENVRRNHARDRNAGAVGRFVEQLLHSFEPPSWAKARSCIFFSAEASDHEFGDTLRQAVTESVSRVLVLAEEEEGKITWITPDLLATWGVDRGALEAAARENLDRLLDHKSLEIGHEVGW